MANNSSVLGIAATCVCAAYAAAVLVMVGAAWLAPDRIVVGEGAGLAWGIGAVLACAAGALLPRRWFDADEVGLADGVSPAD